MAFDLQKLQHESNMLKYNIEVTNWLSAVDIPDTPDEIAGMEKPEIKRAWRPIRTTSKSAAGKLLGDRAHKLVFYAFPYH